MRFRQFFLKHEGKLLALFLALTVAGFLSLIAGSLVITLACWGLATAMGAGFGELHREDPF